MFDPTGIAVLLIAAGASTRLGQPKQLLPFDGKTLLEKMASVALHAGCQPVVVVLGAFAEKIEPAIAHLPVQTVQNENWQSGMGSSIACGMGFLQKTAPETQATILLLCDQPFVKTETLTSLIEKWQQTGKGIVASAYGNTIGPPALFSRSFFDDLAKMEGEKGAKPLMLKHPEQLATISFPEGTSDIDTIDDFKKITGQPL